MPSNTFELLNEFVETYGEKGLRLLLLFEYVKSEVTFSIKYDYPDVYSTYRSLLDNRINRACVELSKKLLEENRDDPTEEEIKRVIESIKSKIENPRR